MRSISVSRRNSENGLQDGERFSELSKACLQARFWLERVAGLRTSKNKFDRANLIICTSPVHERA